MLSQKWVRKRQIIIRGSFIKPNGNTPFLKGGDYRGGAGGKVPVFGLLNRGGRVYTVMIEDAKSQTLLGIIRDRIQPDSIVYTDSFRSYDVLDVSEFHLACRTSNVSHCSCPC